MKNLLTDQDLPNGVSKKFISTSTAYFIKKSHLNGISRSSQRDSEESLYSGDFRYSGGIIRNRDLSDSPQKKNPKIRSSSLPKLVQNPYLKLVQNLKNKNEPSELGFPSLTQNDNLDDDDSFDLENLKTEGAKVVSFGVVISKVTGEEHKSFPKKIIPAVDLQKINRSGQIGQVLRGRPIPVAIKSNRDPNSSCRPVNGNQQIKAKRIIVKAHANKKMTIDGYSLWSERSVEENALHNADCKLKTLVENMSFKQLKNMIFEKKHVGAVDIINKHVPLIVKPRK